VGEQRVFTEILTRLPAAALCLAAALHAAAPLYSIQTVAGSDNNGDGGPGTLAFVSVLEGVCTDSNGNIYLADADDNRIRKIDPSGIITTYAGTGFAGYGGDGGPATQAFLRAPYGIKLDANGNLFVADFGNGAIREITPSGQISTFASGLAYPRNLAFDPTGNLYVSEFVGQRVSLVGTDGSLQPIAGTGTSGYSGDGGSALLAQLNSPAGIAFDPSGALYIADSGNQQIRKVTPSGIITTIEGTGAPSPANTVPLNKPTGIATDSAGDVYVVNAVFPYVREMTPDGVQHQSLGEGLDLFVIASSGDLLIAGDQHLEILDALGNLTLALGADSHTFGDGGPAVDARFESVSAVALYTPGIQHGANLVVADSVFHTLREVASSGIIDSLPASNYVSAPNALAVDPIGRLFAADGTTIIITYPEAAPAIFLNKLTGPLGLAFDASANLYFTDGNELYMATPAAKVQPLTPAGLLNAPTGVAVDSVGNVYVADTANHVIRELSPSGSASIVAGTGTPGFSGDGGLATAAQLSYPMGLAMDIAGNLWIADSGNNRIRFIDPSGLIQTAAGNGFAGFLGDNGAAAGAELSGPTTLVCDLLGNIYVADSGNRRVRMLSLTAPGSLETVGAVTVSNAATFQADPIVAGEIVSIWGSNLGPAAGLGAQFDSTGKLMTQLGGNSVLFNGVPAPLYYVGSSQINAEVPEEVLGSASVLVQVQSNGVTQDAANVKVAPTDPGLFAYNNQAAALNQDYSVNGPNHPAAAGSIIVLFGTGFGATQPLDVTGVPAQPPLGVPIAYVTVTIGGIPAPVLFAGDAPGFVGLTQINARVPAGVTGQPQVIVAAGSASSPAGIPIYVQ
jgi:uncharacterized protein (TIGR03437 family)